MDSMTRSLLTCDHLAADSCILLHFLSSSHAFSLCLFSPFFWYRDTKSCSNASHFSLFLLLLLSLCDRQHFSTPKWHDVHSSFSFHPKTPCSSLVLVTGCRREKELISWGENLISLLCSSLQLTQPHVSRTIAPSAFYFVLHGKLWWTIRQNIQCSGSGEQ